MTDLVQPHNKLEYCLVILSVRDSYEYNYTCLHIQSCSYTISVGPDLTMQ